ncbi:methyltransferase, cyclopropane fatty acid synthase [Hoeflea sp. IMCC20628]|uniref:SAM-dependent methyltransferase n=1 Tax=Hoeflea sp. IMCC20628 TaxID=1620421 RepID=UPI00063AE626|nr:cyclopropane-fatty-acyl-phospholipid synthase family protein [Hoeflea sp. IMCC20628]AKI01110.1 methyltransferase, cyclopropane fatty acid synthase [Hoeflea sp. IMCC20628]
MLSLYGLLDKAIKKGRLTMTDAKGVVHNFGGKEPGPEAAIRFTNKASEWKILLNPELNAAEAYMDGGLVMDSGSIHDLIKVFYANKRHFDLSPTQIFWRGLSRKVRRFQQNNVLSRSRANVKAHYDIGEDLYRLFLDRDMQYSCAYFPEGTETIEQAQTLKKRHIAAKLNLKDGQRVLDIGCGWGGMALYLAHVADVEVLGVTLSERQLTVARRRAELLGVSDRVKFELIDYREVEGTFDRVVSVGMLEHVGVQYLAPYFLTVRDRLTTDGVALIHSISSKAPPGITGPFIRKYIFPGGYAPSLSETVEAIEPTGLWLLDCEIWRCHYGYTLQHWRERFLSNRAAAVDIMGERFCRMWELYLSIAECVFLQGSSNVFQLQIGRERDAVPITRDYIGAEEARIAERETEFLERVVASAKQALDE